MNFFSGKSCNAVSSNIKINENGELVCRYTDCQYCHSEMCYGGPYQCEHYCERAKVCSVQLEKDLEELKRQEPYGDEYYADLSSLEKEVKECKKLAKNLDVSNISVIVKIPEGSYYKTDIDVCKKRKFTLESRIVYQYENGIGSCVQMVNGIPFGHSLYADDIYYYEMKHLIQCVEDIPCKKVIFESTKNADKIYFMYNPHAEREGKPYNFTHKGEDYYGTVVFGKETSLDSGTKTMGLSEKERELVISFINKITNNR